MAERFFKHYRRTWRAFGAATTSVVLVGSGVATDSISQNAIASSFSRIDPCNQLPPIDALGHPSSQVRSEALACWQLETGRGGRSVVIDSYSLLSAHQKALLQENVSLILGQSSGWFLKPKIVVEQASAANRNAYRQEGPVSCSTPIEQTPAAYATLVYDKHDRNFVLANVPANPVKNCVGVADESKGLANIFTGIPITSFLNQPGASSEVDAHEASHLWRLGHAGTLVSNIHTPMSLEDFIKHATYQEYSDPTNIMGSYSPMGIENMTFNPVQMAELRESAVLLHRATSDAKRLGQQWMSINSVKASKGVFALAHLDETFSKTGQDTSNGNPDVVTFDSFVFIPQRDLAGNIASVQIMAYDRTKTHNTAIIGSIPVSSAITTIAYGNQAFQFQVNKDELRLRTVPRDKTGGLQAFLRPSSLPTHFPKAVMHSVH